MDHTAQILHRSLAAQSHGDGWKVCGRRRTARCPEGERNRQTFIACRHHRNPLQATLHKATAKNLVATPTGIELIDTINEELLKSCELTGIWEKKLRDIEHKTYDPADFINGLKEQINQIVKDVLSDNSARHVTITTEEDLKKKPAAKKTAARKPSATGTSQPATPAANEDPMVGKPCPLCGKGTIIKGKTAYGCSNWKEGCQYRLPFDKM